MSETEKNCGSCNHWAGSNDAQFARCLHQKAELLRDDVLPSCIKRPSHIYVTVMWPIEGTDCPCHEPREKQ